MKNQSSIPVEIILPNKWYQSVRYRLLSNIHLNGYVIPEGFISDGASVPKVCAVLGYLGVLASLYFDCDWGVLFGAAVAVFVTYLPPVGRYFLAAVLHDFKLEKGHGWKDSNKAFRWAMYHLNIAQVIRVVMSCAVATYGFIRVKLLQDIP